MRPTSRARRTLLLLALPLALASGCAITVAGPTPPAIEPPAPTTFQPRVEHTVGDFAFTLEGGKMVSSSFIGHNLSDLIMEAWKERGYISSAQYVDDGAFSHTADYELTLSGSQYGESSILLQILCGLTLFITPYTVTQNYDLQYMVEDRRNGQHYSAAIQGQDKAWVQLFLLLALPVANNGHKKTVSRMADHLYQQLRDQGAFQSVAPAPAEPTATPES